MTQQVRFVSQISYQSNVIPFDLYVYTDGPAQPFKGLDKKVEETDEVIFSLSEVTVKQNHLDSAKGDNMDGAVNSDRNRYKAIESSSNSSLHEKVADFIQNGELEPIEGT